MPGALFSYPSYGTDCFVAYKTVAACRSPYRSLIQHAPGSPVECTPGTWLGAVPCSGLHRAGQSQYQNLDKHHLLLWEHHGILATGTDIVEVFDAVDILNKAAKIYLYLV